MKRRLDKVKQNLLGGQGNYDDAVDREQHSGEAKKYPSFDVVDSDQNARM